MPQSLLRVLRGGLTPAVVRPLARRASAVVAEPLWKPCTVTGRSAEQQHGHWCWAAGAVAALALAESQRRQSLSCSSLKRVALGKADEFQESATREVAIGPEGDQTTVLVHRYADKYYVTSEQASSTKQTSHPARDPSKDGTATYKVEVVDGVVFADIPSELADGAGKRKKGQRAMAKRDPKDSRVFALIGGGAASLAAAETLRQEGFGGRILMITKEKHLPYDRTVFSKDFDASPSDVGIRPADWYQKYDIEILHEATVTKLDAKGQEVAYKIGTGKEQTLAYDRVLVASGGLPRKLFCPGATLKGIHTLRTPEDAAEISKYAKKGQKMIVVGGSFIGMEIASTLRQKGCDVAVIAMETVPFERVLGKKVGAAFARLLRTEGVQWYGSAQVRHFRGNDVVNGVELEDGEVLPADLVVVGAGVLPNTRFVSGTSLDKNGGIVVGPLLNSEACPTLFAAGDVCTYPSVRTGTNVRIEHWDVATQQGRVAARNMLGKYQPFTALPLFWSCLFKKNLRFAGYAPDVLDRVIIEGDLSGMEFVSYYTEDDEVRAVATINKDPVSIACAELMRRNKMPKVSELMLGIVNADILLQRLQDLEAESA